MHAGKLKHTGLAAPDSPTDWTEVTEVLGSRADLTNGGIKRPCRVCGHDTYTSVRYPDDVALRCEVCFAEEATE